MSKFSDLLRRAGILRPKPRWSDIPYWEHRKNFRYTKLVDQIIRIAEQGARSALDVGPNGTPIIEAFDWISDRATVDLEAPYASASVQGFRADFLEFQPPQYYDLVLCLQVLEHLPDPKSFAEKLFASGRNVLISVPHLWPEGACAQHLQDPVDEMKLRSWTGRDADYSIVVREDTPAPDNTRLISYYRGSVPLTQGDLGRIKGAASALLA
ncbi:class I SAM-dependent methyltransferase [Aminobacter sp. UC22_36]|uniref:class I SAM-dependent methyltransferase n=1 Tax=Aminobacter sp. UC22_36 TaxID=3374549 RepID=UPI0037579380